MFVQASVKYTWPSAVSEYVDMVLPFGSVNMCGAGSYPYLMFNLSTFRRRYRYLSATFTTLLPK